MIDETANHYQNMSEATQNHAQKSTVIVKEIIGIALEIIELLLAGVILTRLFSWIADLLWARITDLMKEIADLLSKFRSLLAQFTEFLKSTGGVMGRVGGVVGGQVEKILIVYLPEYTRAFTGFYLASGVPQLMSGRPVDWKTNAWQVAVFCAFDAGLNLLEDAIEITKIGINFKNFVTGKGRLKKNSPSEVNSLRLNQSPSMPSSPLAGGSRTVRESVASPKPLQDGIASAGRSADSLPVTKPGEAALPASARTTESLGGSAPSGVKSVSTPMVADDIGRSAADDSGRIAEVLNPPKPLQDGIASAGRSADSLPVTKPGEAALPASARTTESLGGSAPSGVKSVSTP
ncbi:hypothetical protein ACIOWI_36995, partial [Streptomyces sp. NPDC087659]|uniref:hypothetical protein n=1 Tax=Streptomyces sp. NPDC087659 TaxID=3365801 RepID=UPI00380F87FE